MSKIDDLVATVADLQQRVAALENRSTAPARRVIPAPREEGGARILVGAAARAYIGESEPGMPSADELRRLRAIVDAAYPHLAFTPRNERYADSDRAEDWRGFIAAFDYLTQQGRTDRVDTPKALSWHVDGANNELRSAGKEQCVSGRTFCAALVAHGDILFTPLRDYPAFGLTLGGAGRRYAEKWRDVLATGRVLQPVAKPGPPAAAPSPVNIAVGGWRG